MRDTRTARGKPIPSILAPPPSKGEKEREIEKRGKEEGGRETMGSISNSLADIIKSVITMTCVILLHPLPPHTRIWMKSLR